MSQGECIGVGAERRWRRRPERWRHNAQSVFLPLSLCLLHSGRNSRLCGYETYLYNLPPPLIAALLSLAFTDRHRYRGDFDLAWECSSLCGPCESFSHISFCCSVLCPPPLSPSLSSIPLSYHFSTRLLPLTLIPPS